MSQDDNFERTIAAFAVLIATVTEMVRARSGRSVLLDAYDDACDQIIGGLRDDGIADERLQHIHKALARLRLAFEELKPLT